MEINKQFKNFEEYLNNLDYNMAGEKLLIPEFYDDDDNYTTNHAFAISNENLPEFFKKLNLKNKKVLTVGSSGDQALNAILRGCTDVTIIDANIFTQYFVEYKLAVIKTFDFTTFGELFITSDFFNWQTYAKISHLLSPKVKHFYDELMLLQDTSDSYGAFSAKAIKEKMLYVDHRDRHSLFYKNEKCYLKLQSLLNSQNIKINYINAELLNFPYVLKEKYDFIYLSNIYDYFKGIDKQISFERAINNIYTNNLNKKGKIVLNYDFCTKHKIPPKKIGNLKIDSQTLQRFCDGEYQTDNIWLSQKER